MQKQKFLKSKKSQIILGGIFDKNKIKDKIKNFDKKISQENFWKNKLTAQKILKEKKFFENIFENFKNSFRKIIIPFIKF